MNHFSTNDFKANHTLKKFAVPTIFAIDVASNENEYGSIEFLENDSDKRNEDEKQDDNRDETAIVCSANCNEPCNQCHHFQEQVQTLNVRCNESEKEVASCNQTIDLQSAEIERLKQIISVQLKKIASFEKTVNDYETEKNFYEQVMNTRVVRFVSNADDPQVKIKIIVLYFSLK